MKLSTDSARTIASSSPWFRVTGLVVLSFFVMGWASVAGFGQGPKEASEPEYEIVDDYEGMWEVAMEKARMAAMEGDSDIVEEKLKEALTYAEKIGPTDVRLVATLLRMELLYEGDGRYKEAEPVGKRLSDIVEKALPPDHPVVAQSLQNYAKLLRRLRRDSDAEKIDVRVKEVLAKAAERKQSQ